MVSRAFRLLTTILLLALLPMLNARGQSSQPTARFIDSLTDVSDSSLREILERNEVSPLSATNPFLTPAQIRKLETLFQKLILQKDGQGPFHLVIADDMNVGASFLSRPQTSEKVVILNLGILDFVESDDELVAIMGHELEHGTSVLQTEVDTIRRRIDASPKNLDVAFAVGLQKTVESEVDIQSVLNRVMPNGYNVEALAKSHQRLIDRFGDDFSTSHNRSGSRKNHLEAATTIMSRKAGLDMNRTNVRNEIIDGSIKRAMKDPKIKAERLKRAKRNFGAIDPEITKVVQSIKDASIGSHPEYAIARAVSASVDRRRTEVLSALAEIASPEEIVELELEANANVVKALRTESQRIIGPDPHATLPKTFSTVEALAQLDGPRLRGSLFGEYEPTIVGVQQQLAELKIKERKLVAIGTHEARSELLGVRRDLSAANQQYSTLKSAYITDDPDDFFARSEELADQFVRLNSQYDDNANSVRLAQIAEVRALGVRLKHVGEIENTRLALEKQKFKRFLPVLEAFIRTGDGSYWEVENAIKTLPKEEAERIVPKFVTTVLDGLDKALAEKSKSSHRLSQINRSIELLTKLDTQTGWIKDAWEHDPLPANSIGRLVDIVLDKAQSFDELSAIGIREILEPGSVNFASGGRWDRKSAEEIFSSDRIDLYLKKLEHLTIKQLEAARNRGNLTRSGLVIVDNYFRQVFGLTAVGYKGFPPSELVRISERFSQFAALEKSEGFFRIPSKDRTPANIAAARQYAQDLFFVRGLAVSNQKSWTPNSPISSEIKLASESVWARLNSADAKTSQRLAGDFVEVEDFVRLSRANSFQDTQAFELALKHDRALSRSTISTVGFYSWPAMSERSVESRLFLRNKFADYVDRNRPEKAQFAYAAIDRPIDSWAGLSGRNTRQQIEQATMDRFSQRFDDLTSELSARASEKEIKAAFRRAFEELGPLIHKEHYIAEVIREKFSPYWNVTKQIHWLSAAYETYAEAHVKQYPTGTKNFGSLKYKLRDALEINKLQAPTDLVFSALSPAIQMKLFRLNLKINGPSEKTDELFERVWQAGIKDPKTRSQFLEAELVRELYFNDTKRRFANWQLETKFQMSATSSELKANTLSQPKVGDIRPQIREIQVWTDKMFPNKSFLKDEVLETVEARLRTSRAEHEMLATSRQSLSNWHKSGALALSDVPDFISSKLKSAFDRHQMVEYLIGVRTDPPNSLIQSVDKMESDRLRIAAQAFRREFVGWSQPLRTITLQPLLNDADGILSDKILTESVERLLLGDKFSDELVREVFNSYLESVPSGERRVILSHLLAGVTDQKGNKTASIKLVLESMGPFGIKVGQFIRTTGLVSKEVAKDLSSFLDQALPPDREQIYRDLKKTFGDDLKIVSSVGERAGSGSVNYVVVADLTNPNTGKVERVTVRFQRDAVEGIARNEAQVWEKVISKMRARDDRRSVVLANLLDESRRHSMRTLQKGGEELDLSIERANYDRAVAAYEKNGIEVAKPLSDFQSLVPEELQDKVSVYEYIENQPILEIRSPTVARQVHQRILEAEFAALSSGDFDPDGHSGNWLFNEKTNRLVRIDYAMMYKMNEVDLKAFKEVMRKLVNPLTDENSAEGLTSALRSLLVYEGMNPTDTEITSILKRIWTADDFPSASAPHDRLFYIREKLEKQLLEKYPKGNLHFRDSARTALASLSRIAEHAEYVPKEIFEQQFARLVEATKTQIAQDQIRQTGSRVKTLLNKVLGDCPTMFSRLFSRKGK